MAKFGYKRVSSVGQNTDRQDLPEDLDRVFEEKVSAKDRNRPELIKMMESVRDGDEIIVYSIDRLARSLTDLTDIVDELVEKNATVKFVKENLTFSKSQGDLTGRLMLQVLGAISEFERSLIKQRQREGIEKAKRAGKYKGKPKTIDRDVVIKLLAAELTPQEIADTAKIGLASVYRIRKELAEYNNGHHQN